MSLSLSSSQTKAYSVFPSAIVYTSTCLASSMSSSTSRAPCGMRRTGPAGSSGQKGGGDLPRNVLGSIYLMAAIAAHAVIYQSIIISHIYCQAAADDRGQGHVSFSFLSLFFFLSSFFSLFFFIPLFSIAQIIAQRRLCAVPAAATSFSNFSDIIYMKGLGLVLSRATRTTRPQEPESSKNQT